MDFLTDFLSQEAKILLQNIMDAHANRQYEYIRNVLNIDSYLLDDDKNNSEMSYLMDKSYATIQPNNDIIVRRVFVDKYANSILDMLDISIENIIPESCLIDMILSHWIVNVSESILNLKVNLPIPDMSDKLPYITIDVTEDVWKRFLKTCDNCEHILVKDAFKIAIFSFIEDMAKRQLMIHEGINQN